MSLALAITLIVIFDIALLAALAFVMALPRGLRPHVHHASRVHELDRSSGQTEHKPLDIAA